MVESIGVEQLDDLALGAVFLATGGGGDPHGQKLITRQALEQYGPVRVIAPSAIADDAYVVAIGGVGAPTVGLELLPSIDDTRHALDAFERHVGRAIEAVAAFEIGGENSLIPLVAAAGKGIPVVDGDGMGRALPEAQMMSYAIAGIAPTPALARDYAGNSAIFSVSSPDVYERHIRRYAMAAGGMITTVEHPMSGAALKRAIISGTLSFAIDIGRLLRDNRGPAAALLTPLQQALAPSLYGACRLIFSGKVIDKETRISGGYDIGTARIESFVDPDERLDISIKNEYLLAKKGSTVVASVPDLITLVDDETSLPINAERLRYGQRVAVFATGCPAFYRSAAALRVVAPRCFGFDVDYVPLEQLEPL